MHNGAPRVLIVSARFYGDLAEELEKGARLALTDARAVSEVIAVPGALEIPPAISIASRGGRPYDGYIALGCVIRGETSHYDVVANESARGLMDLGVRDGLPIGNGILTVDNQDQAWARAKVNGGGNKGAAAAQACLALIAQRRRAAGAGA